MKQISLFLTIFILFGISIQKEISNEIATYQLEKVKVKNIKKIELKNNGIEEHDNPPTSQGYFPELNKKYNFSQPIFYTRRNGFLETEVSYYYSKKDNVVRLISYSWDKIKSSDSVHNVYNQNAKLFSKYFQNKGVIKNIKESTYWEDEIRWENDRIYVFQFILGNKKGAYRTRTIIQLK